MTLNEIRSLLKDQGFIPREIKDSDIKNLESTVKFKIPELLIDFIKVTNGFNFGVLDNKIISCDILKNGTYEPFGYPIKDFGILQMYSYNRNSNIDNFYDYYKIQIDNYNEDKHFTLPPDKYFPIFDGFGETTVFFDKDTGELVNFVNDGEDPIFDSRTIIASSIEDFIERSSINEFLLEFA